jgi:hypothetical protein
MVERSIPGLARANRKVGYHGITMNGTGSAIPLLLSI